MINVEEKKEKIISFLKSSGPSLPVRVAKIIEMQPMFTSAILSELFNEKRIKMSNMKVGSSQLYFLSGQEQRLEEHIENLNSAEKEAYFKLKENKILRDEDEEPAVRFALRNLKDFAVAFYSSEKLMWKYAFLADSEVENLMNSLKKEIRIIEEKSKKEKTEEVKEKESKIKEIKVEEAKEKIENIFEKEETKSEFFKEVKEFLDKKRIKIIEDIQENKKEIVAKVNVITSIGDMNFLLIAKNKKSTNKDEINAAIQRAHYYKMPCLLVIKKEASRTIQNYIKGNNLIKIECIE